MVAPYIINNLGALIGRSSKNKRGKEGFEMLREQLMQRGGGDPLTEAQKIQLAQQNNPDIQALMGGGAIQQSPLRPEGGEDFTDLVNRAQAVKTAKGGAQGFDYLLGKSDPSTMAQQNMQGLNVQQAQQRHQAHMKNVADIESGNVQGLAPMTANAFRAAGPESTSESILKAMGVNAHGKPSETAQVKNYKFRQSLPEEDKNVFDDMFRARQMIDIGGGGKMNLTTGGGAETVLSPEQFGANEGLSDVKKQDMVRRYGEQVALPELEAQSEDMMGLVDEALAHPGFDAAYGKTAMLPVIPGSERANFEAFRDQGQGKVFLQAYESLKGGGTITEIESAKAEQAIARIGDNRQSPESARAAWRVLGKVVADNLKRQKASAETSYGIGGKEPDLSAVSSGLKNLGVDSPSQGQRRRLKYNPETGAFE